MTTTIVDELDTILYSLGDHKDCTIASRRVLALQDHPTLDALGKELGFTRERVRQREAKIKRRLIARKRTLSKILSAEVSEYAARVEDGLQLDDVWQSLPEFLMDHDTDQPSTQGKLFLYLAGPYEIWHDLLLRAGVGIRAENLSRKFWTSLRDGHALSIEEADQSASRFGIDSPDVVNNVLERIQAEHPHVYTIPGGRYVHLPKASDRTFHELERQGAPLTLTDLAQRCRVSEGTLLNAIGDDDRLTRLDRNKYGLAQWGFYEYDGIVGAIHKALDKLGDTSRIDDVAAWITEHFDVEWDSVVSYASRHHDFVTSNGRVRRRRSDEEPAWTGSRQLGEVGDCLDIDGLPALRVVINANLWRGSGQPVPRQWADLVGLIPGQKMNIGTEQDRVVLSWVGSEPVLGSLRTFALKNGWPQEGIGFLVFDGSYLKSTWRPLPPEPSEDAFKAALAMDSLFALPELSEAHPLSGAFWLALGARLGLQPLHRVPGMILVRLDTRREKVLAPYVGALRRALLKSEARGLVIQIDI